MIIYVYSNRYILYTLISRSINHIYEAIQTFHVNSDERRRLKAKDRCKNSGTVHVLCTCGIFVVFCGHVVTVRSGLRHGSDKIRPSLVLAQRYLPR